MNDSLGLTSTEIRDRLLNRILGMTLLLMNNMDTFSREQQLETLQIIYDSTQQLSDCLRP